MDPEVLAVGEALVDFVADGDAPLADADSFRRRAGGAPANVAAGLARLGVPAWLCSRVGDDAFGEYLVDELAARGVPDRFVQRDAEHATGLAFASGESFSVYRGADAHLDTTGVPGDALDAVSWLVVGGVSLAARPARAAVRDLVGRARDRGCRVCFDPNRRPECWRDDETYDAVVADFASVADVVCASHEDVAGTRFAADRPERVARRVLDAGGRLQSDGGPDLAVVTRGDAGAFAAAAPGSRWGDRTASHAGFDVDAVDATGAGDAFLAGLVAALVDGASLDGALADASACGALATTGVGAMAALPDRAAVDALRDDPVT